MRFCLCTLVISLLFSVMALPVVHLSWWRIYRRCVSIAAVTSLWLFVSRFERRSFRSYGFAMGSLGGKDFAFGIAVGTGALASMLVLGLVTDVCRVQITSDSAKLWRTVIGFLPAALLVGIIEELIFRGFMLQHLMDLSRASAVVISSVLYAGVHLKAAEWGLMTWLEMGGLFLLGVVLALSYLLTKQLYLAVGLHAVLAYGARVNKVLISFDDPSRAWLVGTSRLVNGLVSWVVLAGIGALILWWARRWSRGGRYA